MEYPVTNMSERILEIEDSNEGQFSDILNKWELFFAAASENEINRNIEVAQDELDESWPYMDELCIFSGKAIYPVVHEDGEVETVFEEVEGHVGSSTGVVILPMEDGCPKILFSFNLSTSIEYKGLTCVEIRKLAEYLETDGSITPIQEIENAFSEGLELYPQDVEADKQTYLSLASDNFVRILRSTLFRRLSRSKQEGLVRHYIELVEERSGVRASSVTLDTKVVYKPRLFDNQVDYEYIGFKDEMIHGICHGVESLELLKLSQKAIRCDMDMIDRDAGLCLVVEDTTDLDSSRDDMRGEIVFVPISGQKLEAIFVNDDDTESP